MRGFAVQGVAFGMQRSQAFQWVLDLQQGPVTVMAHPAKGLFGRRTQVNDLPAQAQSFAVRLPQDRTAPGGKHATGRLHHFVEGALLKIAKGDLTIACKKIPDRAPDPLLDDVIGIVERKAEPSGEVSPDGGFAGAGQPDQHQAQLRARGRGQFAVVQLLTP